MLRSRTLAGLASSFVFALFAVSEASATGPWVQTDNGYYATARLGYFSSSKFYDAEGNVLDAGANLSNKDGSIRFDAEYGLSNHMTFAFGMPLQARTFKLASGTPNSFSNKGFGDLNFGLKYGFLPQDGNAALALEAALVVPTGYNAWGMGIPSMGRGWFNALAAVHGGMTFDPAPVYVQGELGNRKYTAKGRVGADTTKVSIVSDALVYGVEAGFFVSPRILVVGEYLAEKAIDTDKVYWQSLSQVGGNVQYRLKPGLDVLAGLRTTVSGKNSPYETSPAFKGTQVRLGIALKGNDLGRFRGQGSYAYDEKAFPGAKPRKAPDPVPVPDPVPAPAPADTTGTPK
jgi:hypothetical protein